MFVKHRKSQHGFLLIELSIVILLIGLVMSAAAAYYHGYRTTRDWENTEERMEVITNAVTNFRSFYGRYPCPASRTAQPGDVEYGMEDCTVGAPGTCVDGICTYNSAIGGETVTHGSIPFKSINVLESEMTDGYLNRFSYAITSSLTDVDTFSLAGGGISVLDKDGNSIIQPDDRGHFIILSHGYNRSGGYTRSGIESRACASGSLLEQENCDLDATFVSGYKDTDFDDRIRYYSSTQVAEWNIVEGSEIDIQLKNVNAIAVGNGGATTPIDEETVTIEQSSIPALHEETGKLIAEDKTLPNGMVVESNVRVQQLCDRDGNNCIQPSYIGGALDLDDMGTPGDPTDDLYAQTDPTTTNNGMSCYNPALPSTQHDFIVEFRDNQVVCDDELIVSCDNGGFISRINGSGSITCTSYEDPCEELDVTTFCGTTETLAATSHSGEYRSVHSGTCYMAPDYDASYFNAERATLAYDPMVDDPDVLEDFWDDLIDDINDEPRTTEDCGPTEDHSLVRDTYQCRDGTWYDHYPASQEIRGYSSFASVNISSTHNYLVAESNDCTCTQSYRVLDYACTGGLSGRRYRVQRKICPRTDGAWENITSGDTSDCDCSPYTDDEWISCNNYYNIVNSPATTSGLSGNVRLDYNYVCVDGSPEREDEPFDVDITNCACDPDNQDIDKVPCPTGLTNSWTWYNGATPVNEEGIAQVTVQTSTCPGGTGLEGLPNPFDPSLHTTTDVHTEACVCDTDLTKNVEKPCSNPDQQGERVYEVEWDCYAADWEDEEDWELIEDNCKSCSWTAPSGSSTLEEYAYGETVATNCSCGEASASRCHTVYDSDFYEVWTNCACEPQDD